jgi:immunity protein 39 of polymorphic toxin system
MEGTVHRIGLGSVGLIPGRVRGDTAPLERARDEVERLLGEAFFQAAPFDRIFLALRYGSRTRLAPVLRRVGIRHGIPRLPVAVELEMGVLQRASPEEMEAIFRQVLMDALLAVATKYHLPAERLAEARRHTPTVIRDSEATPDAAPTEAGIAGEQQPALKLLKLYRLAPGEPRYWETWEEPRGVTIHSGRLGEKGETRRLFSGDGSRRLVQAEAAQRRAEGYAEVPIQDHATMILQYRINGFGTEADLDKRNRVMNLMDEALGWTGLGHCDGGDIGSGTTNVFCPVVDADLATRVIVEELERRGLLQGLTLAAETDAEISVRWPPDYQGEFSY